MEEILENKVMAELLQNTKKEVDFSLFSVKNSCIIGKNIGL